MQPYLVRPFLRLSSQPRFSCLELSPVPVPHISCSTDSGHSYDAPGRVRIRVPYLLARDGSATGCSQIKSALGAKHLDRLDLLLRLSRASAIHDPPPRNWAHLLYLKPYTPAPVPVDFVLRHYHHAPGVLEVRVCVQYPLTCPPSPLPELLLPAVPRLGPRKLNPRQQRKTLTGQIHAVCAPEFLSSMIVPYAIGLTSILFLNVGATPVPADLSARRCIKLVIMVGVRSACHRSQRTSRGGTHL
ncbi:hypothetical protein K438DRAFT_1990448 [Mycena galopus ATCC 62051]|nr:hypothetical protein K438DRAFT_1990448 [Mycena galopus ATCC 62051]